MKKTILSLFLLIAFGSKAQQAEEIDTVVPQTYEYVVRNGKPLLLDVYSAPVPRSDSACVVYLFGGGFVNGSRTDKGVRVYCQRLAQLGFSVIAIDYRLHLREVDFDTVTLFGTRQIFNDAINITASDCAQAIAFICKNAAEWGIAKDRLVLCGGSAGAIGVLQLDYCRANSLAAASELPAGWRPAAVVAYAGAVYPDKGKPKYKTPPAPTFFLHGTVDKIVNYKKFPPLLRTANYGAKRLQKVFAKNKYPYWIFRYEGIGHEVASIYIYTISEFCAFVDATLKGRQMFYDATVRDSKIVPTKWSKMGVIRLYKGN